LKHPAVRFLRDLRVSGAARALPELMRAIEEPGHRALREIRFDRVTQTDRYLKRLKRTFPRLDRVISVS
jgi:hypothetical protein